MPMVCAIHALHACRFFVRLIYLLVQSNSRFVCTFLYSFTFTHNYFPFSMCENFYFGCNFLNGSGQLLCCTRSNATCKQLLWPTTSMWECSFFSTVQIFFFAFQFASLQYGLADSISCNERVWSVTVTTNQWFKCIWKLKTKNRTTHTLMHTVYMCKKRPCPVYK